jgi:hypothetical protein
MTDHDEMVKRIEAAMERYERSRMKPRKRMAWGKVRQKGQRIPLREPQRTAELRETAEKK